MRTERQARGTHQKVWTETGTSLIELMFAMAAGLVVLGATLQALSYFQQQYMKQQREVAQQQDLRLGLEVLEQEMRLRGPALSPAQLLTQWSFWRICMVSRQRSRQQQRLAKRFSRSMTDEGGMIVKLLWSVGLSGVKGLPWFVMANGVCLP